MASQKYKPGNFHKFAFKTWNLVANLYYIILFEYNKLTLFPKLVSFIFNYLSIYNETRVVRQ